MPDLWNSTTHISFLLYDKNMKHEIVVLKLIELFS